MAARITRAKKRIVGAGIPFAVPDASVLPERLDTVAQTAYLAFTAGYSPAPARPAARRDVRRGDPARARRARAASRRARARRAAGPDAAAALASRRPRGDGRLVLLRRPGPHRWHHDEIAEATRLLAAPGLAGPLTPLAASYALQARIAAEHATAPTPEDTRWDRIVGCYDLLLAGGADPRRRLARAVAVAEDRGAGRRPGRARGARDPRQPPSRRGPRRAAVARRATSTPRGRRTTRRSPRAATTWSATSCGSRRAVARPALVLGHLLLLGQHGEALVDDEAAGPVLLVVDADPRARAGPPRPCRGSRCARSRPHRRARRPSAPSRTPRRRP